MRSCLLAAVAFAALGCTGCTPTPAPEDAASIDTGTDSPLIRSDATTCAMDCPIGRACCLGPDGLPQCVDLGSDLANCGVCNRDCVATRRGDSCAHFQCACGDFEIGCTGNENSICCANVPGVRPYCANPGLDFSDCGGCGRACDPTQASQCSGGLCLCGTGAACAGTISSLCCADLAGASDCVDARTDQMHCGRCGNRCTAFERCVGGTCVSTLGDAGVDAP